MIYYSNNRLLGLLRSESFIDKLRTAQIMPSIGTKERQDQEDDLGQFLVRIWIRHADL